MEQRQLGNLGLGVSAIGLGCMGMSEFYGPRDDEASIRTIHRAVEIDVGFVAYSPLGRGFLTGSIKAPDALHETDFRRTHPRFQDGNIEKNLAIVVRIEEIAKRKHCTSAQLALAWVLAQGRNIVPIPGTKRRKYLEEDVAAVDIELTPEDLTALDEAAPRGAASGLRYPEMAMRSVNR